MDLRALTGAGIDEFGDALPLLLRVDRADVGILVERISGAEGFHAQLEFPQDLGLDAFLHQQP